MAAFNYFYASSSVRIQGGPLSLLLLNPGPSLEPFAGDLYPSCTPYQWMLRACGLSPSVTRQRGAGRAGVTLYSQTYRHRGTKRGFLFGNSASTPHLG